MIKKILLVILLLCGCTPKVEPIDLNQTITMHFFYINECSECKSFKKEGIPYLEATFNEDLVIYQYDMDDEATQKPYDDIIDSLEYFDEEFYGTGPFIVVEGYFAVLGYTSGDEELLVQDIVSATNNGLYCEELEGLRFYY